MPPAKIISPPILQHFHMVLLGCWPSTETSRWWWWSTCGLHHGSHQGFLLPLGARAFVCTLISSIKSLVCLQGLVYRERRWLLLSGSLLLALPSPMECIRVSCLTPGGSTSIWGICNDRRNYLPAHGAVTSLEQASWHRNKILYMENLQVWVI